MIKFTNYAKTKIINLIKNKDSNSAILYIKGGGCNGFNYHFEILDDNIKPNKLDELIKIDNYNLYLCNKSLMFIIGTTIDYKEDIMGSRFDFKNDKIASSCGCGVSFNFKDQ